jgi:hypothetical protein
LTAAEAAVAVAVAQQHSSSDHLHADSEELVIASAVTTRVTKAAALAVPLVAVIQLSDDEKL